jgi:hypothetical protein
MKKISLICPAMVLLGLASPAIASDYSGAMTMLVGIPVMAIAAVTFGILAAFQKLHRIAYIVASAAFALLFMFGLYLSEDAVTLTRRDDYRTMYLYFGLCGLVTFFFVVVCFRYQSQSARLVKQSDQSGE